MLRRSAPVLGLLVLAPVCAEYLYGYDESTGNLSELLWGLLILGPLYGGAALLIREAARCSGRGWPTMLLLGLAFGVVQAGLVDHSMFNPSYRDIDFWDAIFAPTFVPVLGLSADLAVSFTIGHMIWSIGVPIAVIESLVPARATSPWLGRFGTGLTVVAFGLAAWFVFDWHVTQEDFLPSGGQLLGAATVAGGLVVAAFRLGRRVPDQRVAVGHWHVGAVAFALLAAPLAVDIAVASAQGGLTGAGASPTAPSFMSRWPGFAVHVALLATLAWCVALWSARAGWGPLHRLALAGGALLANVVTAFATEPIGDVSRTAKLAHNVVAVLFVVALVAVAQRRLRTHAAAPQSVPAAR